MGITSDVKQAIFHEGFFGSLSCRLNQGQLESKGIMSLQFKHFCQV